MTNEKLYDLLDFEPNLQSVDILSQTEPEPGVIFVVADLTYPDGHMKVSFVWPTNEEWIFTPWDWQGNIPTTADDISSIEWRVNGSERKAIMFEGLPRIFGFEPEDVRRDARKRIGATLKQIRTQKGYTTRELAKMCGVAATYISRIESGRYNASIDTIAIIAKALDVDINLIQD